MNSRATISHAKVGGTEYGRESVLTLTLDVRLPTPVEVRSLNEWAASELDWQTRQQIASAQQKRRNGNKATKLTKAQKKAQNDAHELGQECSIASCKTCYPDAIEESLECLEHRLPWQECQSCEAEGAIVLDPEDVKALRGKYDQYVQTQTATNREAIMAAREAAMFLLLIKKPVMLSIAPAQQAFADLLNSCPHPAPRERKKRVTRRSRRPRRSAAAELDGVARRSARSSRRTRPRSRPSPPGHLPPAADGPSQDRTRGGPAASTRATSAVSASAGKPQ